MRRLPDDRPFQPGLAAALEFLDAVVDVVNRDGGNADQAGCVGAAIVDQPIVVNAKTFFLQSGIVETEEIKTQGRVKHLGTQAIGFHFAHARFGVPTAGVLLETFADLMRRKKRRRVAVFFRDALFPQVYRFHDVRVG